MYGNAVTVTSRHLPDTLNALRKYNSIHKVKGISSSSKFF